MCGKPCLLLVELGNIAFCVVKQCNMDLEEVGDHRRLQLNKLEKISNKAYDNAHIYKKKTKVAHDKLISRNKFQVG